MLEVNLEEEQQSLEDISFESATELVNQSLQSAMLTI